MSHIPYGYKIVDGLVEIDEVKARNVELFFKEYIAGVSLMGAARKAGLNIYHGSAGRMLRNRHYLGDEYYPKIISKELFDHAEEQRTLRANALGRVKEIQVKPKLKVPTKFTLKMEYKYTDPFEQTEYAYSLIRCEEEIDEQ